MHHTSHSVEVDARAGVVYGLIADAVRLPLFSPPHVHVERLEFDGSRERLRMWATANGEVRSWISERVQDPRARRIEFCQTLPQAPVESMSGAWIVEERPGGTSRLTLLHDFTVVGDHPGDVAWVELACETNSRAELAGLQRLAACWTRLDDLVLSFESSVRVRGGAELVYDFLYQADDWPHLIPHVTRLDLTEDSPGVQVMSMETMDAAGGTRATESVRICFPHAERIVHKQTVPHPLLAGHTGEWSVVPDETGATVVSQHSVVLREEAVERILGPGTRLATARRLVREEIGRGSRATLELAKNYAESAIRVL
ncbi:MULTISPECIES: aromatase/cyclase [unclassified Streptomyces]|uniref:aromatase/cyclase n=1 Tax=unclassified Streptomyces TaxID=2593676 RepID=UPI00364DF831